jgi:hypothetical protein
MGPVDAYDWRDKIYVEDGAKKDDVEGEREEKKAAGSTEQARSLRSTHRRSPGLAQAPVSLLGLARACLETARRQGHRESTSRRAEMVVFVLDVPDHVHARVRVQESSFPARRPIGSNWLPLL